MFKWVLTRILAKAGITVGGSEPGDIKVSDNNLYRKVPIAGSLVIGDAYASGELTVCGDIATFFERWLRHEQNKRADRLRRSPRAAHRYAPSKSLLEAWIRFRMIFQNEQSIAKSKRVGKLHYDIGNALYRAMLGPMMAYSCGYWPGATTLDQAQRNKYRVICEKLGLKKGDRVLEIGCGWGGFAAFAVENYGVTVVGVSISQEQINFIGKEHEELCKKKLIDLRFMDYRDISKEFKEEFDAIVSVGMFEHVGPSNYDEYMRIAWLALKPGGKFLLHTIVGNGGVDPFTWFRIFRGGILPTEPQIERSAKCYFIREHAENFGYDYHRTLMAWWENFKANWPEIKKTGTYDERFYRMWEFYLKSCAISFKIRRIQLNQYVLSKGGTESGYQWNRPAFT